MDKIDSRMLQDMVVIKGPYTARLGPALRFVDFELIESPRYEEGFRALASTALEYKTNGAQLYGRQNVWGGGQDWGFRVGYGHRTGNDYETGSSLFDSEGLIPASYNSRNLHVAGGYDPTDTQPAGILLPAAGRDGCGIPVAGLRHQCVADRRVPVAVHRLGRRGLRSARNRGLVQPHGVHRRYQPAGKEPPDPHAAPTCSAWRPTSTWSPTWMACRPAIGPRSRGAKPTVRSGPSART